MRRLPLFLLLALLGATTATAQTTRFDVRGTVVDSAGVGIRGATVVALTKPDSVISKFDVSGADGSFTLRRVPAGDYVLQVTFVGFQTVRRDITVSGVLDVGAITLDEEVSELGELVVSSDHIPFVVKKDTLEFNANAFAVRPNAVVEDLLKQLPGVEVGDDGSIKAQGETVTKILVDGKEFFGNDPTIATKNLPAAAVDKVQVFDKKSDMAEFTGVRDGEEVKTINLQLKPGARVGHFGNVTAGFGGADAESEIGRYDVQGTVNRFSSSTQFSLIANINNVNRQGFSFGDFIGFMGGGGGGGFAGGRGGAGMPQIGTNINDGFSETLAIGLNSSHDWGRKAFIRGSYFLNSIDNNQDRTSLQQQMLGSNLSSRVDGVTAQNSGNLAHRLNLNGRYAFADGHDMTLRGGFSISQSDLTNTGSRTTLAATGMTQNTSQTFYATDGNQSSGDAQLTWRKRLNEKGRAVVGEVRFDLNDSDTDADLSTRTGLYQPGDVVTYEEIVQEQRNLGNTLTQTQRLSLTEPLGGGRLLEANVERRSVNEDQDRSVSDLVGGVPVPNDLLSSGLDRTYTYYRAGARYRRNAEVISYGLGVQLQRSQLDGRLLDAPTEISNGYTNLLPSADLNWEFGQGRSLNLRYNTSTREPSMNELQPFADNSDPLNVYVGNPELTPEFRHTVGAHFMLFDQFTMTNLFTFLNFSYTTDKITRSRTVDDQLRQSVTSINAGNDYSLNGNIDYGMLLRPIGARLNLSNQVMYSRGVEFINDEENRTNILRNTVEMRLENRDKELFDVRGGTRLSFNNVNYSLNERLNQKYVNPTVFGEGTVYLGEWMFSSSLNYRMYDKDVFGSSRNVALLEATVSRNLMAQRAEIQLTGRDLLNQNTGINFSNNSNSISEDRVVSLGRYVMLKFVYRLSGIGSRGGRSEAIEVRHMG